MKVNRVEFANHMKFGKYMMKGFWDTDDARENLSTFKGSRPVLNYLPQEQMVRIYWQGKTFMVWIGHCEAFEVEDDKQVKKSA